jgi:hypothetical protein
MIRCVLAFSVLTWAAVHAWGQQCPQSNPSGPSVPSEVRTLEGKLIFHDSIRQWFELKFDLPQCGQPSTELVLSRQDWHPLEVLRGCRVKSTGLLDFSPTGYYSLDTAQNVEKVEPVGKCELKPPFPDFSKAMPDKAVTRYRVDMYIDYEPGDHPLVFRVASGNKELRPWQAYASYILTGGFVLYGKCGEGFVVDRAFGTPQAQPSHFANARAPSDMAMFDPESAAAAGIKKLHLGYTCVREK